MRIASIDLPFPAAVAGLASHRFMEPANVRDADVVLWNPGGVAGDPQLVFERREQPLLTPRSSEELLNQARHWRHQFKSLIGSGGTLVVLVPPPVPIDIHTFEEVMPYDVLEPLEQFAACAEATSTHSAREMKCVATAPFAKFFEEVKKLIAPAARFTRPVGNILMTDEEGNPLALHLPIQPGSILFLPQLAPSCFADSQAASHYIGALVACVDQFHLSAGIGHAAWLGQYRTRRQHALNQQRNKLLRQMQQCREQLSLVQEDIVQEEGAKQLIGGTGRGLYGAVEKLFTSKGAYIQRDWIEESMFMLDHGDGLVAVKTLCIGETLDAALLHRIRAARERISDYFSKHADILIVDCAGNDIAVAQRNPQASAGAHAACEYPCLQGVHLYGWHHQEGGATLFETLEGMLQSEPGLLTALWRNTALSMVPYE